MTKNKINFSRTRLETTHIKLLEHCERQDVLILNLKKQINELLEAKEKWPVRF